MTYFLPEPKSWHPYFQTFNISAHASTLHMDTATALMRESDWHSSNCTSPMLGGMSKLITPKSPNRYQAQKPPLHHGNCSRHSAIGWNIPQGHRTLTWLLNTRSVWPSPIQFWVAIYALWDCWDGPAQAKRVHTHPCQETQCICPWMMWWEHSWLHCHSGVIGGGLWWWRSKRWSINAASIAAWRNQVVWLHEDTTKSAGLILQELWPCDSPGIRSAT
jgi:hypothetical protein